MDKSNDKERICIDIVVDSKCQGDLQGHMIFYMNLKVTWTTQISLIKLWFNPKKY